MGEGGGGVRPRLRSADRAACRLPAEETLRGAGERHGPRLEEGEGEGREKGVGEGGGGVRPRLRGADRAAGRLPAEETLRGAGERHGPRLEEGEGGGGGREKGVGEGGGGVRPRLRGADRPAGRLPAEEALRGVGKRHGPRLEEGEGEGGREGGRKGWGRWVGGCDPDYGVPTARLVDCLQKKHYEELVNATARVWRKVRGEGGREKGVGEGGGGSDDRPAGRLPAEETLRGAGERHGPRLEEGEGGGREKGVGEGGGGCADRLAGRLPAEEALRGAGERHGPRLEEGEGGGGEVRKFSKWHPMNRLCNRTSIDSAKPMIGCENRATIIICIVQYRPLFVVLFSVRVAVRPVWAGGGRKRWGAARHPR